MFNLGVFEILILGSIALLVVGPKNLPALAQKIGEWLANLRRASNGFKQSINHELNLEPELDSLKKLQQEAMSMGNVAKKEIQTQSKKFFSNQDEQCMHKNGKS